LWATTAAEIVTIRTNAEVPSCMRVPPEDVTARSGRRWAVARVTAAVIRSAVATPMEPPRKPNSLTMTATGCPRRVPLPVTTASSAPERSRARASSSA